MSGDPFGRSQLPAHLCREGRVRLIGELAEALLAGEPPNRAVALFVGGALLGWLENGGSLERSFLRVSAKAGSHGTPAAIWRALRQQQRSSRGAQGSGDGAKLAPSSTDRKDP